MTFMHTPVPDLIRDLLVRVSAGSRVKPVTAGR